MNIALSILSAAASAGEAATEAASAVNKWGVTFSGMEEAIEETATSNGGVIDKLLSYGTAHEQVADGDYWSSVGITALSGILVVFLILAILIFVFWLMGTVFKTIDKSKKAKAAAAVKEQPAAAPAAAPAEVVEDVVEDNDDEIIAVISAAIAAYSEEDGKTYAIRKIERKDRRTRSAWSLAGIGENTRPF
ncbi:MAG: OadG family protein [Oscillospiraceae bacterium]